MSDQLVVLDTTVLSNFAIADRINLLVDLPNVSTVPIVKEELERGEETHPYLGNALDPLGNAITILEPSDEEKELEQKLRKQVDEGEAQVLAVAEYRDGVIVTDDGDARKIARNRDIELTGSIGILVRGVKEDQIGEKEADRMLKKWISEGYRAPSDSIRDYVEFRRKAPSFTAGIRAVK